MDKKGLSALADKLLRQSGYTSDGSKAKDSSKSQRAFERVTIIKTPMGNRMR